MFDNIICYLYEKTCLGDVMQSQLAKLINNHFYQLIGNISSKLCSNRSERDSLIKNYIK